MFRRLRIVSGRDRSEEHVHSALTGRARAAEWNEARIIDLHSLLINISRR